MATVTVSMAPTDRFRLRWYDGATLKATEEWDALNTDYTPGRTNSTRSIRTEGLSVFTDVSRPDPRLIPLEGRGEDIPAAVAERIWARLQGTDTSEDWHLLTVLFDDSYGNLFRVTIDNFPFTPTGGKTNPDYSFRMYIESAPSLILGASR